MCCDVHTGVEDLNLGVGLDIAGCNLALALCFDVDGLGRFAVHFSSESLDVEDQLSNVLFNAGNGGKLVLNAVDLHGSSSDAGQGGEQNSSQAVTERIAIAALKGFENKHSISSV